MKITIASAFINIFYLCGFEVCLLSLVGILKAFAFGNLFCKRLCSVAAVSGLRGMVADFLFFEFPASTETVLCSKSKLLAFRLFISEALSPVSKAKRYTSDLSCPVSPKSASEAAVYSRSLEACPAVRALLRLFLLVIRLAFSISRGDWLARPSCTIHLPKCFAAFM